MWATQKKCKIMMTEKNMLKSQEGNRLHLTKAILKTNVAFQAKCILDVRAVVQVPLPFSHITT